MTNIYIYIYTCIYIYIYTLLLLLLLLLLLFVYIYIYIYIKHIETVCRLTPPRRAFATRPVSQQVNIKLKIGSLRTALPAVAGGCMATPTRRSSDSVAGITEGVARNKLQSKYLYMLRAHLLLVLPTYVITCRERERDREREREMFIRVTTTL